VLNPPGSDPTLVAVTITLAFLEGLNSASEMHRLRVILKSSVSRATKTAICKDLALWHSSRLSKDSTGIHSDRGLAGSDGGNTSSRLLADPKGSTSDVPWVERRKQSSALFCSPVSKRTVLPPMFEACHRFVVSPL
jgi:hypothetical protein